jgi:DNA primase
VARIPQDELDRLKREVDLAELVRSRGVKLSANGKDLVGLCPLHEEAEPSFRVSPSKNVFHCFGCGAKGTVVDFVMRIEGVTFRHAVEILRAGDSAPAAAASPGPPPKKATALKLPPLVSDDAEISDEELRGVVADYYHETLKQSPEAQEYLASRGLDKGGLAARFRLGYSDRTLGYRLPQRNRKNGKAIRSRLAGLGIIKDSGHELMRGSLVVPIFDGRGQVVQLYGRKIGRGLRPGVPKHLYLPGPRRGLFNLEALRQSKEVILCEALIDALTFIASGYENATAAYGTNGFTDELLEAMKSCGTRRVLIAFDRDDAGDKAAEKLAARLGGGPRGGDPARRPPLESPRPGPKPQLRDLEGQPPGRRRRPFPRGLLDLYSARGSGGSSSSRRR